MFIAILICLLLTVPICLLLFFGAKKIDYLSEFKQNSIETIARIKYIDIIGYGDDKRYSITIVYKDENGNKYTKIKRHLVYRTDWQLEKDIKIRYQKSNPKKWHFNYEFETIETPSSVKNN